MDFDPNNAKGLFRRALAAREIGISDAAYLKLAYHDLVEAIKIEPTNQDIQRELQVARIAFFASDKRKSESPEGFDREYEGKKTIVANDSDSSCSQVISVFGVQLSTVAGIRVPDEAGTHDLVMIKNTIVECQD